MSNIIGRFFLILGPSGVGKGVTVELLRKHHPECFFPRSVTTRPMRMRESDGNPYFFVSQQQFEAEISKGAFLEYAKVHDLYYYGTRKQEIMEALKAGKTVIKELDIQGFHQARSHFSPGQMISIFMLPPSKETLIRRIKNRSKISEEELRNRMESLEKELRGAHECDIQIQLEETDTIEKQYKKIEAAILANI